MPKTKNEEMIQETPLNVLQKLAKARLEFLNRRISKSGTNEHLEFHYFELEDIVPAAIRIFADLGLTALTSMDGEQAVMTVRNADNPEEPGVAFALPYRESKPIISSAGKEVTNPMQALGASVTYLRRYLWMLVLDVTEPDGLDANLGENVPEINLSQTARNQRPLEDRTAIRESLTNAEGPADALQIAALKSACKALLDADPEQAKLVQDIALKTNGFSQISKTACENLVKNLGELIQAVQGGTEGGS